MHFEGSLEVLKHLFMKQTLLERGDERHQEIRPVIVACPGVIRGAYGAGQVVALEQAGLTHVFDCAVGSSTGLPTLAFFLAAQAGKHSNVYWKEAASKAFIAFEKIWKGGGSVIDTEYLCGVFREKLDQAAVCRSRTALYACTTCAISGDGYFVDTRRAQPDVVEAIHASIAVPGLSKRVVSLEGRSLIDGAGALEYPVREVVEKFLPTDLLVLANCPKDERASFIYTLALHHLVREFPLPVRKMFLSRDERRKKGFAYLRSTRTLRWGILWSDTELRPFEKDPYKIEAAFYRALVHLSPLLTETRQAARSDPMI
jgi:predicted patatin/cPLA2 family phospholipase